LSKQQGSFLLFGGGAAIRSPGHPFLGAFVEAAGGVSAQILILTCGSDEAAEINGIYWELFASLGATRLVSPIINSREEADQQSVFDMIAASQAVFIAGGAQSKLMEKLSGTAAERAIHTVYANGGLLGGTSCGASIFGDPMILDGGFSDRHLRKHMIDTSVGFNMLGHPAAVDTHCSSRARLPRMLALLIEHPQVLGIGMDEDTGLFIDSNGMARVMGYNAVFFVSAKKARADAERMSVSGIELCALRDGDRYDLRSRKQVP
jgi:cyanophycinase